MLIKVNDNIELFYKKTGQGTPLLLLHGNGETHHVFDKLAEKLEKEFTVYAVDSRNHGESQKTEAFSYEIMTEDIYSFIKKLNLGKVSIIGFSDGAIISLMLAMKDESVLEKIMLLGINLKPNDFTEENLSYLKNMFEETKDPLIELMLKEPNIELKDVAGVTTPTLIVAGDSDLFKPEMFCDLKEAMGNAQLKIMEGHEHDTYLVDSDLLYDDVVNFLK